MLMLTVWMMGIATALIGILPSFLDHWVVGTYLLVTLRHSGTAVAAANGEAQRCFPLKVRRKNKKAFTVAVYKLATE